MNRRQAIRTGALAVAGLTVGAVKSPISGIALAQQQPVDTEDSVRFGALPDEVVNPVKVSTPTKPAAKVLGQLSSIESIREAGVDKATFSATNSVGGNQVSFLATDNGKILGQNELAKQFLPFQVTAVNNNYKIVEFSSVEPKLETTQERPDVVIDASLDAFHMAESEQVGKDTKASFRLTIGSDKNTDRGRVYEDTLYWAITAGMNLWNNEKNRKSTPKELEADFGKALGSNYIELPGGIGDLRLEVIKHTEPPWWRRAFNFLKSDTGSALTSVLGFPAVTKQVVEFVDQIASRLENTRPEMLIQSRWVKAAFSKQARDEYTMNSGFTKIGVLQPGHWVLAKGEDWGKLNDQSVTFHSSYGLLLPSTVNINDFVAGRVPDPFANITYAIIRARVKPRMINVGF